MPPRLASAGKHMKDTAMSTTPLPPPNTTTEAATQTATRRYAKATTLTDNPPTPATKPATRSYKEAATSTTIPPRDHPRGVRPNAVEAPPRYLGALGVIRLRKRGGYRTCGRKPTGAPATRLTVRPGPSVQVLAGMTGLPSHPPPFAEPPQTHYDTWAITQPEHMVDLGGRQNVRIWRLLVSTVWTDSSILCIKTVPKELSGHCVRHRGPWVSHWRLHGMSRHSHGCLKTHFGA